MTNNKHNAQGNNKEIFRRYRDDINLIMGLFAFGLFISCLSLTGDINFGSISKQRLCAGLSFVVMLIAVIYRGNGIRHIIKKETLRISILTFTIQNPIYSIGMLLLALLVFGVIK